MSKEPLSSDEQDQEVGRAYRELSEAERERVCLERKLHRFKRGMKDLMERAEPDMGVSAADGKIVRLGGLAVEIECLSADEFARLLRQIKQTRETIQTLKMQLSALTGRSETP